MLFIENCQPMRDGARDAYASKNDNLVIHLKRGKETEAILGLKEKGG